MPCASCMSPLFDKEYKIEHDVVEYRNTRHIDDMPTPHWPISSNRSTFEEAIAFIGSGKTVLTNSYHGAYWATLLGREAVIIDQPNRAKFYGYKHQPAVGMRDTRRVFPNALEECREANIRFNEKVQQVING